jgi:hypothetical protein
MGMFDDITCEIELPLNDELRALPVKWEDKGFQTKDLENCMLKYTISKDGRLLEHIVDREYTYYTEEEKKHKRTKPWDLYKEVIIKGERDEEVNHHGVVTFYSDVDYTEEENFWVEFNAYFVYGKLDKINLIKCEKQKSRTVYHKEWDEQRKIEDNKLWNRVKRILRCVGWSWFWHKISKCCYSASSLFASIQTFIIRHLI